ncbi:MAG TPA: alpha/beta hydrolase [Ilumatobacteraceae bacterium]|nr:alpha/beta hydrolase [Ilumatobacteraceae bacterium]
MSHNTDYVAHVPSITEQRVSINGYESVYLSAGEGPLAVVIHGFPDSAHSWRRQLLALADAGYHAVAAYQRGYFPSAVPDDGRYQTAALAIDANALHDALGGDDQAVIIGHDWGAMAATGAAVAAPDRWRKVVTMAVPPAGSAGIALLTDLTQLKRSWYMFFFQSPMADGIVAANDLAFIDMLWRDWSPGHDADDDIAHVKAAMLDPQHLAAVLGYYRAMLGAGYQDPELADIQAGCFQVPSQPMLYLHGADDGCMGADIAESARAMVPDHVQIQVLAKCGHFLQVEQPDAVNQAIIEFLR